MPAGRRTLCLLLLAVPLAALAEGPQEADPTLDAGPLCPSTVHLSSSKPHQRSRPMREVKRPKPELKWTAKIGLTTFRTTMVFRDGALWIGTHGPTLDGKNERGDGVYVLDAKTGQLRQFLPSPGTGDRDVGGIALTHELLLFGTDNGKLWAQSLTGQPRWSVSLIGKVRPAPAYGRLSGDEAGEVVIGDEDGQLLAASAADGTVRWKLRTGQNDYGARGFLGAVALVDVDGDHLDDVIAGGRDGVLRAIRGKDGACLWAIAGDSGIHASPTLTSFTRDGRKELLAAWSYGELVLIDPSTGAIRWQQRLELDDGGIEGIFGTPTPLPGAGGGAIVVGTAWWGDDDGVSVVGRDGRAFRTKEGRVSSSAVVTDLDGDGTQEAILGTEKGLLLALTANGTRAVLAELGAPIEATPLLADVDGDGLQELFVAANDGQLRCYSTAARSAPVSRLRGPLPENRGELELGALDWKLPLPKVKRLRAGPPPSGAWTFDVGDVRVDGSPTSLTIRSGGKETWSACRRTGAEKGCTGEARYTVESLVGPYLGVRMEARESCGGAPSSEQRLMTLDGRTGVPVALTELFPEPAVRSVIATDRFVQKTLPRDQRNPDRTTEELLQLLAAATSSSTSLESFLLYELDGQRLAVRIGLSRDGQLTELGLPLVIPRPMSEKVAAAVAGDGFLHGGRPVTATTCTWSP